MVIIFAKLLKIYCLKRILFNCIQGNDSLRDDFLLSDCYCIIYRSVIMYGWNSAPDGFRKRLTFLSILTGGMILYWYWEAMLITYFSVPTTVLPFNSLEEFLTKSDKKVLVKHFQSYKHNTSNKHCQQ